MFSPDEKNVNLDCKSALEEILDTFKMSKICYPPRGWMWWRLLQHTREEEIILTGAHLLHGRDDSPLSSHCGARGLYDCLCVVHYVDMMENTCPGNSIMQKEREDKRANERERERPSPRCAPFLLGPHNSQCAIGFADGSPRAAASILMTARAFTHGCMEHAGGVL